MGVERLFVRSEVREVIDRFGDEEMAAELDGAVVQARDLGIDFAEGFFAGRWLSLTGMEDVSNMYGAMAGVNPPAPEEVESFLAELETSFDQLLGVVTVETLGRESAGHHLRVVASAGQLGELAADLLERVGALMAGQVGLPPGVLADELRGELANAPEVDVPSSCGWTAGSSARWGSMWSSSLGATLAWPSSTSPRTWTGSYCSSSWRSSGVASTSPTR